MNKRTILFILLLAVLSLAFFTTPDGSEKLYSRETAQLKPAALLPARDFERQTTHPGREPTPLPLPTERPYPEPERYPTSVAYPEPVAVP